MPVVLMCFLSEGLSVSDKTSSLHGSQSWRSPLCPASGPLRASHMLQGPPGEDGARSQRTHAGPWRPVYPHWFLPLFLASSSTSPRGSVLDLFLLYLNVCPPLDALFYSLENKSLSWPFLNLFPDRSLVCLPHIIKWFPVSLLTYSKGTKNSVHSQLHSVFFSFMDYL